MRLPGATNEVLQHLTYHELGREKSPDLYRVSCTEFEKHLIMLRLLDIDYSGYHITFDDGHLSNYDLGLPLLEKYGVKSTFFITTEWIGVEGRMSVQQLRRLLEHGHQVESHSCSHPFLPDCSDERLRDELVQSRRELEDILGVAVNALSLPYGRWDRRVLRACREAGYSRVYTSDPWLPSAMRQGVMVTGRLTLRNSVDAAQLQRLLTAKGLAKVRLQMPFWMKQALKLCVGDRMYHRLWHAFANRNHSKLSTSYER
jgi:hypothetical protein